MFYCASVNFHFVGVSNLYVDCIIFNFIFSVGQLLLWLEGLYLFDPSKLLFYVTHANCSSSKCSLKRAFWNKKIWSEDIEEHFREQRWKALLLFQKCSPISFAKVLFWQNALFKWAFEKEHFMKGYWRAFLNDQKRISTK